MLKGKPSVSLSKLQKGGEQIYMINIKKLLIPTALNAALLAIPAVVMAQAGQLVPNEIAPTNNAVSVIRGIIRFILVIAFVLAFVMLIIGGIRWILAGGDEKAVSGARGMITGALIGLVIVLVAYAIIRLVELFFNVQIISNNVCIPTVAGGCAS